MSLLSATIIIWLHHSASPTACIKEHKKKGKIKNRYTRESVAKWRDLIKYYYR